MAFASINSWCTPAYIYFVLSIFFILVVYVQSYNNRNIFCLGTYSCDVSDMRMIIIFKFIFILFWTWILNLLCRFGFSILSWILVILPFIFIITSMSMLFVKP
jgi:hypothetical protein